MTETEAKDAFLTAYVIVRKDVEQRFFSDPKLILVLLQEALKIERRRRPVKSTTLSMSSAIWLII